MNMERYIALTYPFFHQRLATRWRIIIVLVTLEDLGLVQLTLSYRDLVLPAEVAPASFLGILSLVLFFLNYKIFMIARKIRKMMTVSWLHYARTKEIVLMLKSGLCNFKEHINMPFCRPLLFYLLFPRPATQLYKLGL